MSMSLQKLAIGAGTIVAWVVIAAFILLAVFGIDSAISGAAGGDECESKGGVYVQSVCIDQSAIIDLER